ncbi:MAG: hypothetical protein QHH19_04505 [Candidatus Thermoplasmatota archaeon]|jgi:hypothetical protein|nr:hypothetical protein [Candidatus Thermoplasmatota archaeon]
MKRLTKTLLKLIIFSTLLNLPLLTIIHIIGIDAFLDSFENPDVYHVIATDIYSLYINTGQEKYILLQKASHPRFYVKNGDTILYYNNEGKTACNKVYQINSAGTIKTYDVTGENIGETPIYETQIYGKVLCFIDSNPWNILSIKIWEISTHTTNFNTFF